MLSIIFFLLFLNYSDVAQGCHWPNSLKAIEQKIMNDQEQSIGYINEIINNFEATDPFYHEHAFDFLVLKSTLQIKQEQLARTPHTHPERLCSPDTTAQMYQMGGIKEDDPHKPIIINNPGMGLNGGSVSRTAILFDVAYFKANRSHQSGLLSYALGHEFGHCKKHQADINQLKKIHSLKLYIEKAEDTDIPAEHQNTFQMFKESVLNACKTLNHAYEFGADFESAKKIQPIEDIDHAIVWLHKNNFPTSDSHPSSTARIALLQKVKEARIRRLS